MVKDKRSEMIEGNIALVHSVAARFRGRGYDYDDLFQSGCVGLIKAVDNFDESLGFCFSTYAVPVIMGEIKRLFRDNGAVKVSRSIREKAIRAKRLGELFMKKEQREPTVGELAEMLGCDSFETAQILNAAGAPLSLSEFYEDDTREFDIPYDDTDEMFDRLSVSQVMDSLQENEKILINERYFKGKTQSETAAVLGISQVQVSRKEKAILQKMRRKLQ